MSPKMLISL